MVPFAVVLATLALSGAAEARPPNPREAAWFYNRPGVELPQFEVDSNACAEFGAQMVGGGAGQNHGLVGLAITGALAGGNAVSFADECMIARGYRRFDIAGEALRAFAERFAAMPPEQRLALVSAESPSEGALARRPSNNIWLANAGEGAVLPREIAPASTRLMLQARVSGAREGNRIAPGPNDAIVIVSVRSTTADLAAARFSRVDPNTGAPAPVRVRNSEHLPVFQFRTRSREPQTRAFVLPAGTYALIDLDMLQLCLGTFAFTVEPGDVVDLGLVSIDEEPGAAGDPLGGAPMRRVRIDPSDGQSARAALAHAPELAARIEAPAFVNGVQYPCNNAFPWAVGGVVMPGAPYHEAFK